MVNKHSPPPKTGILSTLKPKHDSFNSFVVLPKVSFESQRQGEKVYLVLRAHPITQIPWIINAVLFFFLIMIINQFLPTILSSVQILFLNLFGLALIFAYVWFNFLSWFFNVGIVTNERVIDMDFGSVIYRETTETTLGKIEDLTNKSGGFLASFIDYGNVFIQTAGTEANIEFLKIPHPSTVVRIINDLINNFQVNT